MSTVGQSDCMTAVFHTVNLCKLISFVNKETGLSVSSHRSSVVNCSPTSLKLASSRFYFYREARCQ